MGFLHKPPHRWCFISLDGRFLARQPPENFDGQGKAFSHRFFGQRHPHWIHHVYLDSLGLWRDEIFVVLLNIVVPLAVGFIGLGAFGLYETSKFAVEPTTPPHLFKSRTTVTAFFLTFMHAMLMYWITYFLPVYFQGVLQVSPSRSGVLLLPLVVTAVPGGILSGLLLTKFGRYKPLHIVGNWKWNFHPTQHE